MDNTNEVTIMKREAKNLASMIAQDFSHKISHSDALERVAALRGFKNWDTAIASVRRAPEPVAGDSSVPLTLKTQLSQLFALRVGLRNCKLLPTVIKSLQEQPDPAMAAVWARVKPDPLGCTLSDILGQIGIFDDATIAVARVSDDMTIQEGVGIIIEYFQLMNSFE